MEIYEHIGKSLFKYDSEFHIYLRSGNGPNATRMCTLPQACVLWLARYIILKIGLFYHKPYVFSISFGISVSETVIRANCCFFQATYSTPLIAQALSPLPTVLGIRTANPLKCIILPPGYFLSMSARSLALATGLSSHDLYLLRQ